MVLYISAFFRCLKSQFLFFGGKGIDMLLFDDIIPKNDCTIVFNLRIVRFRICTGIH